MQAVILAAGKSKRYYPFTSLPHKSITSIMGMTLLERTLYSLKEAKVENVVIVIAENSPIPNLLSKVEGLKIKFVTQKDTLGMGHALLCAKEYLEDEFFLLSGYHFECKSIIPDLLSKKTKEFDVVLSAKEDVILERYGVLETDGEKVKRVIERPKKLKEKGLRVIAIYLLSKKFLEELDKLPVEHYHFEKALDEYAISGHVTYAIYKAQTVTLKYAWDLLTVKDLLLQDLKPFISKKAYVSKHAIIEGNVYISDGAKILEGVCIKGPCYIGENVMVGNNAIIRNGVILEKNVVVGATMEVKNSIILDNTTTHTGFIGDSIIGKDNKLAAGFLTANVRLDRGVIRSNVFGEKVNTYRTHVGIISGDNVNFGVNVTIMPGIIIGNNSTIGPSTIAMENVDDNFIFYTKFETVLKKKK
ncbi:MAG TPA: sugar phosphate nucleotidyltransferase [Patescibacteria group bacterium]